MKECEVEVSLTSYIDRTMLRWFRYVKRMDNAISLRVVCIKFLLSCMDVNQAKEDGNTGPEMEWCEG